MSFVDNKINIGFTLRRMVSLIWPINCSVCDTPLRRHEHTICLKCIADLPRIRTDHELPYIGTGNNNINIISWFLYSKDYPSHRLIHDIKYHGMRNLARRLGREFAMQKLVDANDIDILVPIPLHWSKFWVRGYNQTREIALGIKDVKGVPVSKNLYAVKSHVSQTLSSREQRAENVSGIFEVRNPSELDGKHIALVDDVITTGATMFSALDSILKSASPRSVTFLSLARTQNL